MSKKLNQYAIKCPDCGGENVTVTAEQMFMINTGDHYCHKIKAQDSDAKCACLNCEWRGVRADLEGPE